MITIESSVYISGPMSGYPDHNIPTFERVADILRKMGYHVHSPHEIKLPEDQRTWENYMRQDIILVCKSKTVITLEHWEHSRGARIEVELAHSLGIPVFPSKLVIE